jgi:hypothetical protein
MLKLEVMLSVKTNLSTRPVSFNTKPELEVYRLENNARIMLYGEHERSKKRLKVAARGNYMKVFPEFMRIRKGRSVRIPFGPPVITFPHYKVESFLEVSIAHSSPEGRS